MIVDIEERPPESGTFELKGGGKVTIRLLTVKDIKEIHKATATIVHEYPLLKDPKTGEESYRQFAVPKFDGDLWDEMQWDRSIIGWEDLFDKNGKPVPVTKEMKVLLMSEEVLQPSGKVKAKPRFPEFHNAVMAGLKTLQKTEKERAESLEKNSSAGLSGVLPIESSTANSAT
jgi:hypothetical protein